MGDVGILCASLGLVLPPRASRPELPPPSPPPFAGGSAKALGLLSGKDREDSVTHGLSQHKSSDDDDLNESAATVQRPLPAARASQVDDNPFAAFENDQVDEEGSLPTEALIRPDATDIEDKLPTAIGQKKIRMPEPLATAKAAPAAAIKTPMAMSVSSVDDEPPMTVPLPPEPAPPPESGQTRVAMIQAPAQHLQQPPTASIRDAYQRPLLNVPPPQIAKPKVLPPHKVALIVSMFLLAAALFIVFRRSQQANAVTAAQPPAEPFPPAVLPVEVAPAPLPLPAPLPTVATVIAPPAPAATTPQAQPERQPRTRRPVRAAVRPAIPSHREQ